MKGKSKAEKNNTDARLKKRGLATEKVGKRQSKKAVRDTNRSKRPSSAIIPDKKSISAVGKAAGATWKFMSDAAMDIGNSILGKVGEFMLDSIKFHYGYLKRYDDNIVKLDGLVKTLEARETDVLKAKKAAERNGEEIVERVQQWIRSVDRVKEEARKFLEDNANSNKRCFRGSFPNMRTIYMLSREAESKHEAIEKLFEEQEKFGINVSLPAPPLGIDSITSKDFVPFQTTKLAMEKVMDALKEDSTHFVGIHGMGGVGKTTLVKQIGRKCKEETLFDNVVMAVVSQTVNIESIQNKIADFLGLKLEEQNEIVRASRLYDRLKREDKILVILDDIWAELDLEKIGIPSGEDHKGCKVVITTRRRQVCSAMGRSVQDPRIVCLDVLTKRESWDLFKSQAVAIPTMRSVAEKVCKECGGLPIALVTVGKAMRGKDPEEWKEAAVELEKSKPVNIEGVDENVFKCIKFSYDYLRDEEVKACFLLCCLFPEDYEIDVESLVRYGVGLNIFKGIDKIQEARRRAHSIIKNLKASSLLVAVERHGVGEMKWLVKMHDVVRDVAKEIASNRYFVKAGMHLKEWPARDGYNGVGGISLMGNEIRQYPDALECPDLEILLMQNNCVEREVPEEVFKGMKKLRVLDQSFDEPENRRLEPSFRRLTSLQTLTIDGYSRLTEILLGVNDGVKNASMWGIGALGELKMLQVISFRWWRFEEPLDALRKMKNLRLLDLAFSENCSSLFNLAEDCSFPQLEELYLTEPVSHSVVEVMKCCRRLNVLWFHMDDISHVPHNFDLPHYFNISMGGLETNARVVFFDGHGAEYIKNTLYLSGENGGLDDVALPNKIGTLMARVSVMTLRHLNGLRNIVPYLVVDKDSLKKLEKLKVEFCNELEYLINIEVTNCYIADAFLKRRTLDIRFCPKMSNIGAPLNLLRRMRLLEVLEIWQCEALEYLFDVKEEVEDAVEEEEEEEGILANLKDLRLTFLSNLKELWKGNIGLVHLRNLKTVNIWTCPKLKFVFHWSVAQRLEQLQELGVGYCDELEEIVRRQTGEETVHYGHTRLKTVVIYLCPKLKVVFHWSVEQLQELRVSYCDELEDIVGRQIGDETVRNGPPGFVPFRDLKQVFIGHCPKLKVVFHWSVARRLEQLQNLSVWDCDELEAIVGRQTGEGVVHAGALFPELQDLSLYGLPKLNDFYTSNVPGSKSTPKLKMVRMGKSWRTPVEIAVDGMNLDRVIKDHKELLVPGIMEEEEQ